VVPLFIFLKGNIMKLRTDHSFHIGEQHLRNGKPCQDYALSGRLPNELAYAIVSDGCSSGELTDIGSRLLSLALKQALADGPISGLVDRATAYLKSMQRSLELGQRDMLATGLMAFANNERMFSALITGDGVIVQKSVTGSLIAYKYEWSDNTPFYLAYDEENRHAFLKRKPVLTVEQWSIGHNENYQLIATDTPSPFMIMREGAWWHHEVPHGPWDLDSVAVMSDGVLQVDELPWQKVVWELMNFKSTSGQFVTRRMNRFLSEAKKNGRGPIDDIAMAVIHLEQKSET
jgi:hypothetical protein